MTARPTKSRLTTALASDARDLLDSLTDEPGEYLSDLIREHYSDLHSAISLVRAAGWTRGEVLAVCDACNGLWLLPHASSPEYLAIELADGARLGGILAHGASADTWDDRVREVRGSPELAGALLALSRAWWRNARAVEQWIDGLPTTR